MRPIIKKGIISEGGLPEGFVITDSNLFKKYGGLIKGENFIIEAGEKSKTLEVYEKIILNSSNVKRIIAFGGGVVGDLAGFVAATYKRGIELIQVPTSLMAMVDSSIGGKNGVNFEMKKNYLGTFYQPQEILIDPLFLRSLSEKEFRNGVVEIVKYGVLFGVPSLERLAKGVFVDDEDLEEIIFKCVNVKIGVVRKDEKDFNYRHVLNFGHTIGHAIELIYELGHGEAIAIGMLAEMKLGRLKNFFNNKQIENVRMILKANNLASEFPRDFNVEKVLMIMKSDKKGEFAFAFSERDYDVKFSEEEVRLFLENERFSQRG